MSVFITPWMNPSAIHCATSEACASNTRSNSARYGFDLVDGIGVVTPDGVVGEPPHERRISLRGGELERSDPEMARRDAHEHRTRQHGLARHVVARRHDGQRTGRRYPERGHRRADHVLAQHRPDRRLAVAAAGERGAARPLQVQVAAAARRVDDLAEQQRPTVAELRRIATELMAGVGHRDGLGAGRNDVADEHGDPVRRSQLGLGYAEFGCEVGVEREQFGRRRLRRLPGHDTGRRARGRRCCRT